MLPTSAISASTGEFIVLIAKRYERKQTTNPLFSAFFPEFDDFLISSINGEANTDTQFWTTLVNFQFIPVGGCQQEVHFNDEILYAFDGFAKAHILKLSGPFTARKNHPVIFTVIDGSTGAPVAGADVDGQTSGIDGKVSVTFAKVGVNGVKAQKDDSIRSNQVNVVVVP